MIDKGKLALAMYDITFDARPLEQEPISTMPAAISGGNPSDFASANPTNGITRKLQRDADDHGLRHADHAGQIAEAHLRAHAEHHQLHHREDDPFVARDRTEPTCSSRSG